MKKHEKSPTKTTIMLKKKSHLFLETSLALSSSLPCRVVTSSLRSSKLSRSCRKGILYETRLYVMLSYCRTEHQEAASVPSTTFISAVVILIFQNFSDPPLSRLSLTFYVSFSRCTETLTLHSCPQSLIPEVLCVCVCLCAMPKCIATFLLLCSQHSPPRIQHLLRQEA